WVQFLYLGDAGPAIAKNKLSYTSEIKHPPKISTSTFYIHPKLSTPLPSTKQPTNPPNNQPTNPSTNQATHNQPTNPQPTNQPTTNQPIHSPTHQQSSRIYI